MRGWERVTPTDLARLGAHPQAITRTSKPHKFHAQPCLVTENGTLFTDADIRTVEVQQTMRAGSLESRDGTLVERAARVGIHGRWFASLKEGRRYWELRLLERAGTVTELQTQVPYDLTVVSLIDQRPHSIGTWIADFEYRRDGARIVEDAKGVRTPLYRRARRHVEAQYGIRILET